MLPVAPLNGADGDAGEPKLGVARAPNPGVAGVPKPEFAALPRPGLAGCPKPPPITEGCPKPLLTADSCALMPVLCPKPHEKEPLLGGAGLTGVWGCPNAGADWPKPAKPAAATLLLEG